MTEDEELAEAAGTGRRPGLDMPSFFPYRLAVLAEEVSRSVAAIYQDRFSMTRHEWRMLAALADLGVATATELGEYSTLDKMQVSRALADMEGRGLVRRAEGRADRRTKQVGLTGKGRRLFEDIVPLVREREAALLSAFSATERQALRRMVEVLTKKARILSGR